MMGRLVLRDDAIRICEEARRLGRVVVFTNGCFDVLHRGHVDLLAAASREGDLVVVGLNSDASVRRLKGPDRPWIPEEDRAEILAALAAVDLVVVFPEDTPRELVEALGPDVLVKGGDYREDEVVGGDVVRARGGRVVIAPLTQGRSSTDIRARMQAASATAPGEAPGGGKAGPGSVDTSSGGLVA